MIDTKLFSDSFYIFIENVDSKQLMWETGRNKDRDSIGRVGLYLSGFNLDITSLSFCQTRLCV